MNKGRWLLVPILAALLATTAGCAADQRTAEQQAAGTGPAVSFASNAPPGSDEELLASYPKEVQAKVKEERQKEGAHAVAVGDDLWIIVTAGNNPGAAVDIEVSEVKDGALQVVYTVLPLPGVSSATGVNPQPYNVFEVKGAAKATVTFTKRAAS